MTLVKVVFVKSNLSFLFSSLLMIAWLTGCSGEKPQATRSVQTAPSPSQSTPAEPTATDSRPVIVAFGDSLTAGYGVNAGQSYPDDLERDLNALGYRYRVVNAGISGNTSKDGVLRIPEVLQFHPSVVIVAFGGNDGLRGLPIRDTKMNLRTIISKLQDAHAKVILGGITLPPNYGSDYISQFNAIYKKAAAEYHVPLLPFMLKDVYDVPGSMQNDGIHPTAQGCQQVARNFLPLLLPMLQKQGKSHTPAHHPS
jgi:acyl-CoA thioesterase-1